MRGEDLTAVPSCETPWPTLMVLPAASGNMACLATECNALSRVAQAATFNGRMTVACIRCCSRRLSVYLIKC